jgi:hypothetical protein
MHSFLKDIEALHTPRPLEISIVGADQIKRTEFREEAPLMISQTLRNVIK